MSATVKIETFSHRSGLGWSVPAFPKLDSERTLVLVFGAGKGPDSETSLADLLRAYPTAHLLGCSTAGEILGQSVVDDSLAVAVCRFDDTSLRSVAHAITLTSESFVVGSSIAQQLASPDLRGVFVLSDGTKVNGSELCRGLNSVLSPQVLVTGGLAADGDRFVKTWVLDQRKQASGVVSAVGFYGDRVVLGHGSKGGWDVFGPERIVTRSAGNVLFEIENLPALDLYKRYLGDLAIGLPANALLFPLRLRRKKTDPGGLVRTILSIDEKTGSMTFAGDIPEGSLVQFMRANLDRLVDGAMEAAHSAKCKQEGAKECLAIAVSCVGRRLVLSERVEEEIEALAGVLPEGSQIVGFYSYGELSPISGGRCDLHNQTMTLTTISER
jgi:hypothetical protein